jgi:uncharacterized RDD family membrane protein YckC
MFIIQGTDGKEYGPVTTGHIGEWIRDGRANLVTKARRIDDAAWKTLGQFEEFGGRPVSVPVTAMADTSPPVMAAAAPSATASLWLRFPAAVIDGLLKVICFLPTSIPVTRIVLDQAAAGQQRTFAEMSAVMRDALNTSLDKSLPLLAILLVVQMFLLARRGQSIGKLMLGLRIVRLDGSAPGFLHAFLLRSCAPFLIEQIPLLGLGFWIVDSCFVFRADRRCVHDLLADTRVVKA